MIKYVIWDLDGVLVEARELHYKALNRALARFSYNITRDEHLSTYDGLPTQRKLEMLTAQKGLDSKLYDDIWREKQEQTLRVIDEEFTYDERIRGILDKLKKDGHRQAVCSNSIRESVKMMLLRKGLLEYMDFFLSNQDVNLHKPHPEMFLKAMVKLGAKPKECLIVEDSHRGREAAHASGAYVCGVKDTNDVTYEKVSKAISLADNKEKHEKVSPKWQGDNLRIVVPMAGEGKSYQRAGFTFPKPLVDVLGKPMIQWVVENMNTEGKFVFIVLKEHFEKYSLNYLLNLIAPGCEIIQLNEPTQGAAISVLEAQHLFNDQDPVVVVNSDQLIKWNSNEFFYAMAADECDGGIVTFESTHPKWSFVKTGKEGFVTETAEKKPISNQATAGVYYFKQGSELIKYAKQMIDSNVKTNNEYFVCPIYSEYIKDSKKIRAFPIEKLWSFSTPEDLELFIKSRA